MIRQETFFNILFTALLILLVTSSQKEFVVWSQVLFYWDRGLTPEKLIVDGIKVHFFRYALLYPVLQIAEMISVKADMMFGLLICIIYSIVSKLMVSSLVVLTKGNIKLEKLLFIYGANLTLFLNMNGRITFAIVGYGLMINLLLTQTERRRSTLTLTFLFCLSLWLSGVSSGTMLSTYILLAFVCLFTVMPKFRYNGTLRRDRRLFLAGIICLGVYIYPAFINLYKNIKFYGSGFDGFIAMTEHGIGSLLNTGSLDKEFFLFALVIMTVFLVLATILFNARGLMFPITLLSVSLVCGFFGYSTLGLSYIPVVLIILSQNLYLRI